MAGSKIEHRLREIEFLGKRKQIVLQNAGVWSPLVEISNILLLREELPSGIIIQRRADGQKYIKELMLDSLLNTYLVRRFQECVKVGTVTQGAMDLNLPQFQNAIFHLSTNFSVYPTFKRTNDFEETMEKILYNTLDVDIYHGWLVNSQDTDTSEAVGMKTHRQLLKEVEDLKASKSKGDVHRVSLIQNFLNKSKTQLTSYGLAHLVKDVPEGVLSLLFREDRISVLYKNKGILHVLVTAEDVLENHPDAMWKKLENVDEDGDLVTSTFGPINVNWRENERILIEDERKAEKQKQTRHLKNVKKRERRKGKRKTVTQDESGEANKDLVDETEANTPEDKGPASPQDGVLGSSQDDRLKDRFMQFLKEFLLDGKSYFRGQVESMLLMDSFHLIICYGWITTYDKELAVSICNNYYRAAEDLRQCFCDYFHSIIQEKSVAMDQGELYTKIKLTICCLPRQKRILSFEEFAAENCMYIVYELDGRFVNSTSYIGRMMALGYLQSILRTHKSGYSWNGNFDKSHMSVKIVKGIMIFKIKIIAAMVNLNIDSGIADFNKYKEILFPLFKRPDVEGYPAYFGQFMTDFMAMPDPVDSPVEFEKFQKYMGSHLFAKAPLVRSGLVTNTYRVCESLIVERPVPGSWPVYPPLDIVNGKLPELSSYKMSAPLRAVLTHRDRESSKGGTLKRGTCSQFDKHTYWCALMFERHAVEHLLWHTKKEKVQTIKDRVLVDLTIGHDLDGLMAMVVKFIIKTNNFDGPFSSVWRTFMASETLDEPAKVAAVDDDGETETRATAPIAEMSAPAIDTAPALDTATAAAPGPATAAILGSGPTTAPAAQPPPPAPLMLKCEMQDQVVDLLCNDLSCLEDKRDVFDSVIDFVYARIALTFAGQKDILLVRPAHAFLLGNMKTKAEVEVEAKPLDLKSRRMVFVPVNDNTDYMRADSGKHWSLLVIHVAEDHSSCRFVHHDSLSGLNRSAAVKYVNALKQVLPKAPPVIDALTPRQLNGSDCGLCVLTLTKAICTWWIKSGRSGSSSCWVEEVNSKVTGHTFAAMRGKLRQKLMEEMQHLASDPTN